MITGMSWMLSICGRNDLDSGHVPHNEYYGPVFLYLNDVEEGGGTHFNELGITVQPKTGRAVIWPSVYDFDTNAKDFRTRHEALAVISGVKYGGRSCCF